MTDMKKKLGERLALHLWTVDSTPLAQALPAIRRAGWEAVELRWVDFERARAAGLSDEATVALVRASGLHTATIGAEYGLIYAQGAERDRLLASLERTCANAVALGCGLVMIAPGPNDGTLETAAANFRAGGEIAARHGLRFALEFNSAHPTLHSLAVQRAIHARAAHPACGLLLDAYHLERSGAGGRGFEGVPAEHIHAFQYSDVPAEPHAGEVRRPVDRLCPGRGVVRWKEVFGLLIEKGYDGPLSYEAPNPEHWKLPAEQVAREGLEAVRQLLAEVE
jgi:sugar phosphate isomerase/epimerase